MNLRIKIEEDRMEEGYCIYYQSDYTLEYQVNPQKFKDINKISKFLLIYDTLTIEFDEYKKFMSFDAYTNKELWGKSELIGIKKIEGFGALSFAEGFEEDNRYSYKCFPKYEYSNDGRLKIHLLEETSPKIYQISSNLLVGVENETITSFIVLEINFV